MYTALKNFLEDVKKNIFNIFKSDVNDLIKVISNIKGGALYFGHIVYCSSLLQ